MTILELLVLLIIAAIIGAVGQAIAGFYMGGCLVSSGLGFIGALVGIALADLLGLPAVLAITVGGTSIPLLWAIIGATLFVAVLGILTRGRRITIINT